MSRRKENPEEQQRRIEARRAQILEAAAKVFARKGFHQTTTREVATEAGMAEGTIYNYFGNKRELLVALVAHLGTSTFWPLLDQIRHVEGPDFFRLILRDRIALIRQYGAHITVVLSELLHDEELRLAFIQRVGLRLLVAILPEIQRRIDRGEFRRIEPQVLLPMFMGATLAALAANEISLAGRRLSDEELVEHLAQVFYAGLSAPEYRPAARPASSQIPLNPAEGLSAPADDD